MVKSSQPDIANVPESATSPKQNFPFPKWLKSETTVLLVLLALTILTWLPRFNGPIDMRWDSGVYYILGTSLAEGKGYKMLNEPGEIDAVQYPPLLPAIVAAYQLVLGTNDPTTVGWWLRISAFIIFIVYIYVAFNFFKNYLSLHLAFLATVLCIFSQYVYFLSDLLFPEVLFSLATLLFILFSKKEKSRVHSGLAYVFAVISYALRTVGIAALAVWVLESLVRRQYKQAIFRGFLVLIPIICWQSYIVSIESSYAYNHPAYAYQRAPYLFYNVSYARNVQLIDTITPEKGYITPVKLTRRFVRNLLRIPANIGETFTSMRGYLEMGLRFPFSGIRYTDTLISWSVSLILFTIGIFALGGLALQLFRGQWIVPLYAFIFIAAMCLTPYPDQFLRYLMPIAPLLALSLIVFLLAVSDASRRFLPSKWANLGTLIGVATLTIALSAELMCIVYYYSQEHQQIAYIDRNNQPVDYRLFYYNKINQGYDDCINYIKQNANPDAVVGAGQPHWVYLRAGLKTVMTPFEIDPVKAQELLDSVPVSYLIIGQDPVQGDRYTLPVIEQFSDQWEKVYFTTNGDWVVYQRVNR